MKIKYVLLAGTKIGRVGWLWPPLDPNSNPAQEGPRRGPGGAIRGCQQGHKCHPTLPFQGISLKSPFWRGGNNILK